MDEKKETYEKNRLKDIWDKLFGVQWMHEQNGKPLIEIAVYGAGMVAMSTYYALKILFENYRVICFIVTDKTGNPSEIDNIPVMSLEEFIVSDKFDKTDLRILVAVPENHHQIIARGLNNKGLNNYFCIDSKTESILMEQYHLKRKKFSSLHSYESGTKLPFLKVYMTKFYKDIPLKNSYNIPDWIYPIQAGAALCNKQIADIQDSIGENISEKNRNYCELSALYWIWKNVNIKSKEKKEGKFQEFDINKANYYLGLVHYRRILDVTEEDLYRIRKNNIDVILPYPTVHYPSMDEHHRRYVKDSDWEAMISALKEIAPNYAESFPQIVSSPYFYNFNIFIAKEIIFKNFCEWLFPILERTEELSIPKGSKRADRYIGYLGENLTTLYFMYHQDDFKIAHTGRLMLI